MIDTLVLASNNRGKLAEAEAVRHQAACLDLRLVGHFGIGADLGVGGDQVVGPAHLRAVAGEVEQSQIGTACACLEIAQRAQQTVSFHVSGHLRIEAWVAQRGLR